MTVREVLAEATKQLDAFSGTARLDAELLMAHALGCGREEMLLKRLEQQAPGGFDPLVERRLAHEPVAYITGRRAFWTIELEVGPGVLIPRPDSETLIEAAIDHFGAAGPDRILDLGTGPGTLLLAALDQWPKAKGVGVDASPAALDYARRNADRLSLAGRADFRLGDWADGLSERFDLILCNPPYVGRGAKLDPGVSLWEPPEALYAGDDALDEFRRLPQALRCLRPGGIACVEIGAGQQDAVRELFESAGFCVTSRADLAGIPRCIILALNK